ncbi:MAG TPA: IMP dehydrogenase, partial [Bacteroidales bacterium]|nr:IMP dehydrogenase [Bacteroidales bacterium]
MKNESKILLEGLTFDDVLLIPAYSEVLPNQVSIASRFSRNIVINTPIVSAAMDTVTDSKMAIAMAREGGIGVIHKNMSVAEQAKHVYQVKRAENAMILSPVTINIGETVGDAKKIMSDYNIGGIPVVDADNKLKGIVTSRDMRFQSDMSLPIKEIMTSKNLITTEQGIELDKAKDIFMKYRIEKLPV